MNWVDLPGHWGAQGGRKEAVVPLYWYENELKMVTLLLLKIYDT